MGPLNSVWLGTLDIACLPGAYVYFSELLFLVKYGPATQRFSTGSLNLF